VTLPREHFLDELATAYIQVLAARAGATIAISRLDYGVDGTLKNIVRMSEGRFVESGFPVDFQLKGTASEIVGPSDLLYDLKVRNYDLLGDRRGSYATPYYLFLVCLGSNDKSWVTEEPERMVLDATGYWWEHSGTPSRSASTVRIRVSRLNRLTSDALERMMVASRERFLR
jgi:Domain of unknown function (DUF4365)